MSFNQEAYKQFWEQRYSDPQYAYGREPNLFFKEQLTHLCSGNILLPAEGEGRNAVYAAGQGWKVSAFDLSEEAKKKALQLATEFNVHVDYQVGDLEFLNFSEDKFDVIGLIYAHFLSHRKSQIHHQLIRYLKKGGTIIFEAYSKNNLPLVEKNPKVGGNMDIKMLFSKEEILADFTCFEVLLLEEKEVELHEGIYHNGVGSVVRFVGKKL